MGTGHFFPIWEIRDRSAIISKNKDSYYLEEYNEVLNKNSEHNQLGYIKFAETIIKRYENLENAIKNKEVATNSFKELTEKDAESFMQE